MQEAFPLRPSQLRLALIVLIAAVLRLVFLGARSFWADEIVSVKLATDNWGGFWFWVSTREANMALYYLLLRGWVKVSDGESWVRLFSALAGIATVPFMHSLVRCLYDERVAWITALLTATSACLIEYSQEARSYGLVILLCVLSYYFFARLLKEDNLWLVPAYILVSSGALYAHFFAALVLGAQAVSVLWLPRQRLPYRRLIAAWTTISLAAVPISVYIFRRDVGQLYWVQPTTFQEVYKLLIFFAGGSKAVAAMLSVLSLTAVGVAIASKRHTLRAQNETSWRFMLILLWAALPVALTVLVSLHKPVFVHRYLLVALPGYLVLIALGLARIRRQAWLAIALVAFIGLSAVSIVQGYHRPVEDWRGVVDHVLSRAQPDDTVLIYIPYGANNFFFYTMRREREGLRTPAVRFASADSTSQLESSASPRTWLLLYPSPHVAKDAPILVKTLQRGYAAVERKQFHGIEVLLFSQPFTRPPSRPPAASAPRR